MAAPKTFSDVALRLAQPRDATRIAHMSKRLIEAGLPWSWKPERVAKHIRHRDIRLRQADSSQRTQRHPHTLFRVVLVGPLAHVMKEERQDQ